MTPLASHLEWLKDLFGTENVSVGPEMLAVGGRNYPIVDGVVILLDPERYTPTIRRRLAAVGAVRGPTADFAPDIQETFGAEWQTFSEILPDHRKEFDDYFDLLPPALLKGLTVCDLGCGIGRWSHFLAEDGARLILVDFSDAIFVARRNLGDAPGALFFMGDLTRLPFRDDFADVIVCLGVLHHLPLPALNVVRSLRRYAPRLLVYLYYSLENRPAHFRALLAAVTLVRRVTSRVGSPPLRQAIARLGAVTIYLPLIAFGRLIERFGRGGWIPLHDSYSRTSLARIEQDVYDRFFTRIEQRFSRKQIRGLADVFTEVEISPSIPYWHFMCRR